MILELSAESLELADLLAIMENAINLSKVAALMQSVLFDYRMLPFCSSVAGVFFDQHHQESLMHTRSTCSISTILFAHVECRDNKWQVMETVVSTLWHWQSFPMLTRLELIHLTSFKLVT